jgi:uncharacterized membrane protein YgcG
LEPDLIKLILTFETGIFLKRVTLFCNFVKTLKSSNLRLKHLKAFTMKRQIVFLITALALVSLSSCSTYKNTATTPDDVYYSPGQPVQTTVTQGNNSDYYTTPNENYVKMRVQNPNKWSYFDDYNYDYYGNSSSGYGNSVAFSVGYSSGYYGYGYGYGCGFGYYSPMSYYNSYYAWNNFYNPYYGSVVVVNGKNTNTPSYVRMSNFNPSAYRGSYYNARPIGTHYYNTSSSAVRNSQTYFNSHTNNNTNRSAESRPSYTPTRSTPSNFSSGGGSSGGGGGGSRGGGFSRPGR